VRAVSFVQHLEYLALDGAPELSAHLLTRSETSGFSTTEELFKGEFFWAIYFPLMRQVLALGRRSPSAAEN
jgi:hypothetical protein